MGPGIDKLFLEVAGAPVVAHTWRRFDRHPAVDAIVVVVRAGLEADFRDLATRLDLRKSWRLAVGGAERQDSVWNGLEVLPEGCDIVAIQDAARPCTPAELIGRCLEAAHRTGASVAAQRATDTIKESNENRMIARHLDRSRLWTVQTPQCFRSEVIKRALNLVRERRLQITDDTAACDLIGQPVELVESLLPNPKVTQPSDLPYINLLLSEAAK
jgi:2-C-methyl-D-erythritol 4-phosphate cytidylyltransferase